MMPGAARSDRAGKDWTCDLLRERAGLALLPLHRGRGHAEGPSGRVEGEVEFLVPVGGPAVIALRQPHAEFLGPLSLDRVHVSGEWSGRPFRMACSTAGVRGTTTSADSSQWALLSLLNGPVAITYDDAGAFRTVRVRLNNFDYTYGDIHPQATDSRHQRISRQLTVIASGREVRFSWVSDHTAVGTLLETRLERSGALVEFAFDVWADASEADLVAFAEDVATAGTFVAGQLTNVAMVEVLDKDGHVGKRIVPQPVTSPFSPSRVVPDEEIPRFFEECFSTHRAMRRDPRWRKLSSYCGTVEACPTLEQKFMSVAIGLEFVMRNALIDADQPADAVEKLELGPLVGKVRRVLGWNIPRHYEPNDRWRVLRNALAHGNERPEAAAPNAAQFRQEFDKLKLLLYRLALLKLGYRGNVLAPSDGRWHASGVDEFAEDRNTFRYGQRAPR